MRLSVTSCSNPALPFMERYLPEIQSGLESRGYRLDLEPLRALAAASGEDAWRWDPRARATLVNSAFADDDIAAILDISGGDLAGEVIPYLDFETIRAHPKPMVGYSDNSCVLGALPIPSILWSPRAGIARGFDALDRAIAGERLRPAVTPHNDPAAEYGEDSLRNATWLGGNLRCFLKLAGTHWWPDFSGKVLLIESLGADLPTVAASLAQHRTLGTFGDVLAASARHSARVHHRPVRPRGSRSREESISPFSGRVEPDIPRGCRAVVVGQLTELDKAGKRDEALALVAEYTGDLPIFEAAGLGHSEDSEAVTLG